jgi:hypothetical protein
MSSGWIEARSRIVEKPGQAGLTGWDARDSGPTAEGGRFVAVRDSLLDDSEEKQWYSELLRCERLEGNPSFTFPTAAELFWR